jgi:hypothetical protein
MSCTVVCGMRPMRVCGHGNASGTLGVHGRAVHGQNEGRGRTYSWSGRRATVGWRGRWCVGLDGEGSALGFLSTPQPNEHALGALARERGRDGEVGRRVTVEWGSGEWGVAVLVAGWG